MSDQLDDYQLFYEEVGTGETAQFDYDLTKSEYNETTEQANFREEDLAKLVQDQQEREDFDQESE